MFLWTMSSMFDSFIYRDCLSFWISDLYSSQHIYLSKLQSKGSICRVFMEDHQVIAWGNTCLAMNTKLQILLFVFYKKVEQHYLNYWQNAFYRNSYENPLNINLTLFGLTEIGKLFIKPFVFHLFCHDFWNIYSQCHFVSL